MGIEVAVDNFMKVLYLGMDVVVIKNWWPIFFGEDAYQIFLSLLGYNPPPHLDVFPVSCSLSIDKNTTMLIQS